MQITARHWSHLSPVVLLPASSDTGDWQYTETSPWTPTLLCADDQVLSTFNWINQLDVATSQVYYLSFKCSSTCFGHHHAHHQELQQL
jgi:hypothetical protein